MGEARVFTEGEASLVACYVPDLERDVVAPLREAGYSARRYGLWERLMLSRDERR